MLILTVIKGPDQGRRFELPDDEPQLIGRSSEALPLQDPTISRRHSELTPDDGRWYINDLQSNNGTFVNGRRVIERRLLQPGDQIRTGNTILMFGRDEARPLKRKPPVKVVKAGAMDVTVERTALSSEDSVIMAVPEPSEAAAQHLKVLFELTQLIGTVTDREDLLERVMDVIFEYVRADRGFILLLDSPTARPHPAVVRHRVKPVGKHRDDAPITVSKTIVQHVMQKGEGVLSSNAMSDERFSSHDSVQRYGIRSALCSPIKFKDRLFGVIHLDSKIANYTFTEDQLLLLNAIGVQTGLALANAEKYARKLQEERLAAVGQTVASLSHSIKNIIQGLRGGAEVVELGLRKNAMETVKGGWDIVARNLERISQLTMNMLAFSKQRVPDLEMRLLKPVLEDVLALMQRQFDSRKVAIITDIDDDILRKAKELGAAAAPPREAEALHIDLGPRCEIVERPHRIPGLDARRRVPARRPPPHPAPARAVMLALDLAHLQRVENHGHIPMLGQPRRMVLVCDLRPIGHAVLLRLRVAADIEHRGRGRTHALRKIETGRDIEPGERLKIELLDREARGFEPARDRGAQIGSRRQRREAEHVEQLVPISLAPRLPVGQRADLAERARRGAVRLATKMVRRHTLARRKQRNIALKGEQKECQRGQHRNKAAFHRVTSDPGLDQVRRLSDDEERSPILNPVIPVPSFSGSDPVGTVPDDASRLRFFTIP